MRRAPVTALTTADPRWARVVGREACTDFVYSVQTTGIYCWPSCPSRRPLPTNVVFHSTALAAELAGFRPCKRCRPAQAQSAAAASIVAMCRLLEESENSPSLQQLAAHVELSESHAHRIFTKALGVSPKGYREAVLRERVRDELASNASITRAIYAAGFNSAGRFYERVERMLGMSPTQHKAGGNALEIRFAVGECSLGAILVAATARGVCAVLLGTDPDELVHDLEGRFPKAELRPGGSGFDTTAAQVIAIVDAAPGTVATELPLDVQGTAFQQRVWLALSKVPYGTTITYSELARAIGNSRATRAVANACAENPAAVVIPCHRVVRTDGSLSGYRWGVERKRQLLRREAQSACSRKGE